MKPLWLVAAVVLGVPNALAAPLLRPVWNPSRSYGESFTFVADLEDGSYVQLSFHLTNLGPGSTKAICRSLVVLGGERTWTAAERFSRDGLSYTDAPERLAIGPCSAWSGENPGAEAALDGGRVALRFSRPLWPAPSPAAAIRVGRDGFLTEVLLYRSPVEAELELPGEPPRHLAGSGYADHSRGTVRPSELARRWIRFRALRGDRALLVLGREALDGTYAPLWTGDGTGPRDGHRSVQLERSDGPGAPAFLVRIEGGAAPLTIRSGALLYRDAPVEDLGLLGKLVAPFIGSPVTYVYRARAAADGGDPVDGILEVELARDE